jgi:RHS repeat-associated protein
MSETDGPVIGVTGLACSDALDCTLGGITASTSNSYQEGVLLSTSDGGTTWSLVSASPTLAWMLSIACPSGAGWCIWTGADPYGAVGGYTGTGANLPSASDYSWSSVSCPNASDCWIVGQPRSGSVDIWATTNGGVSWTNQTPASGFSLFDQPVISCPTSSVCFADGGGSSTLMDTTNGGTTWSLVSTLPSGAAPDWLSCPDANHCVATNNVGSLKEDFISTNDGGSTWTTTAVPTPGNYNAPEDVVCADSNSCWATDDETNGSAMMAATDGITAPEGGGISLGEVFGGLNPSEPCFSCYLKAQGAAAQSFVGEPINTATGDFYESLPLFSLPGRGVPISFTLTYDAEFSQSQVESGATSPGPDGWGWTDNYEMSVSIDPVSYVATVVQENGSQISFTPSSASACPSSYTAAAPRITATLSCATVGANTVYSLASNGGLQVDAFTYNSSSQLTQLTEADANANTTTVLFDQQGSNSMGANYNAACPASATTCTVVADPAGRTFVLEYNGSGQLTGAVDPDGNTSGHTWSFTYDSYGDLSSVTDRNGDVTSFGYDTADADPAMVHNMTSLTPPNDQAGGPDAGDGWVIVYDSLGRVYTQTDPQGLVTSLSYTGNNLSPEGGTTTITDPHGNVTVQTYAYGILTSTTTGVGTSNPATWTYVHDPVTLMPTQVIDPNGNTTTSTYDADGNALTVTDPLSNETVSTYNSFNEPLTITDPLGIETENTYDSHGDLTETAVNGLSSTYISTTYVVCQTSCPSGYVAGDVESMTDPNGKTTTYTYDSHGDLASTSLTVSSLTDVTSDSYNTLGEQYCEVSPNANAASVSCPAFGASRVADTSTWVYNADGNVTNATDAAGNTTAYTYDADGNQTQVTDPLSNVTKTTYDADDRTSTVTSGYGTSSATTTTNLYDIAPGSCPSAPTGTTYCTQVENGLSNTTTSYYNALDQMIEQAPPNTTAQSVTTYTYDGVGNVLTETDASGTTTNTYDDDNRLTGVTYSGTASGFTQPHAVTYHYDADGNRTQMTDGTGTTTYGYDGLERLDSVDNGAGNTVTYKYDPDGNQTCVSYPNSGSTTCQNASSGTGLVTYQYNEADQATQMTDWLGHSTSYTYDNDGNLTKITYPSGTLTSATDSYDNTDALTDTSYKINTTTTDLASLTRNADELIGTTKPAGGSTLTYGYDSLNRVTIGTTGAYTYDAASEMTSATPTGGSATDYAYNADGQLCWTGSSAASCSSPPSGAINYSYDSVGDRASSGPTGGNPTTYGWDQAGNLVCDTASNTSSYSCSSPNSSVTSTHTYDGDGLEASTTYPSTTWTAPSTIDSTRSLSSISCVSTTFCMAVDTSGYVVQFNGSTWTASNKDSTRDIAGVSCTSTTFCMAVDESGYYLKYNGSTWSTPASFDTFDSPQSVSCVSSTFCIEVGSDGRAYHYNGTSWSTHANVATSTDIVSVSCTSSSFCMAVDTGGGTHKYNGSWSSAGTISGALYLSAVSCSSSTFCVAVDWYGHESTYNGSSWSAATVVDPQLLPLGISCTSSTFCQAVDGYGDAFTYNGTKWVLSNIDGTTGLPAVSCTSSTFCDAVDTSGHVLQYGPASTTTADLTWDVSGSVPQLLDDGSNYYLYGPNAGSAPTEQISVAFSEPSYLISDTTGVRLQVSSVGAALGSMSYDSYGNPCSTCEMPTPFRFEGGYTDSAGLVYLIHRYYDSTTGQFLSVDPLVRETGTPYEYTAGDPVNASDPSGLCVDVNNVYHPGACSRFQIQQLKAAAQLAGDNETLGASSCFSNEGCSSGIGLQFNPTQGLEGGANFVEGFGNSELSLVNLAVHYASFERESCHLSIPPAFVSSNPLVNSQYRTGNDVGTIYGYVIDPAKVPAYALATELYYYIGRSTIRSLAHAG